MKRRSLIVLVGAASLGVCAQVVDLNDAINKAGRQRMLSQRMAKFFFSAALRIDATSALGEIGKARTEFLSAMEQLRGAPEATAQIREELALGDNQWLFFDLALQKLQGASANPKALSVMDRVTGMHAGQRHVFFWATRQHATRRLW